ncbi:MAG TPA: MBL fold metallo-hydrolase [Rubrivivax sp.]|nr:MBL fold metallo-hydrolase [Rubrivivax sp.]
MEGTPAGSVLELGPVRVYFGEKSGKYPDGNQVVVRGADSMVVFDTPQAANRLPEVLADADFAILGHVHEDHMAGLHLMPAKPLYVPQADLEAARSFEGLSRHYGYPPPVMAALRRKIEVDFHYEPRPDAVGYADGAAWELGGGVRVRAHHMPGHTAGHSVLLVEPDGIAFIGDIDLSSFGPYYGDATSSLADFRRTLTRLRELPARGWITSHHKGVVRERAQFLQMLDAFAARIDEREARLLQMLAPGPQTLAELARQRLLYPAHADDLWIDCAEARSIEQHLRELLADGRIARDGAHYRLAG